MSRLVVAVALAATLCACATPGTQAPREAAATPLAPLTGTRWIGVVAGDPDPRSLPRLEFVTSERVTGYTGCNMLNGKWQAEGASIRVGPLVTTKRACAGPEGDVERRLLAAIHGMVERTAGRLVFIAPGGERFEFTPAQAS